MFDLETRSLREILSTWSYLISQWSSKSATRNCKKHGKSLTSASVSIRAAQRKSNLLSLGLNDVLTQREQTNTWAQLLHPADTSIAPKLTPCGLGAFWEAARCRHQPGPCGLTNKNNRACCEYISMRDVPLDMIWCLKAHHNTHGGKHWTKHKNVKFL